MAQAGPEADEADPEGTLVGELWGLFKGFIRGPPRARFPSFRSSLTEYLWRSFFGDYPS